MINLSLPIRLTPAKTIIICLSLLNIFSISALYSSLHQSGEFSGQELFHKQIAWITIAWLILIFFSCVNYRLYFDLSYVLYGINILLLVAVILIGRQAMGAQRWLNVFGINFQPSELSKLTTVLLLARIFSLPDKQNFAKGILLPLILLGVSALLIFKQPDLGTALMIIFIFFTMGFASGIKKSYFIALIAAGMAIAPLAWQHLKDYQKQRLIVFINPNVDPLGSGYTIIQSKIAVGSGQFLGKGFLAGTQNQFNFLPERHTDFIFTVIAEEGGFIGSLFLLFIYGLLLHKILSIADKLGDPFARNLSIGISAVFFLHAFVNIGMTLSILPVVGLPLIFVSYGGTNLLMGFILAGIFININKTAI